MNSSMVESFDLMNAFKLSKGLESFVFFEQRKNTGTEHLMGLVHAIQNVLEVRFIYIKFWEGIPRQRKVKPLALKEYKHRWYLLARDENDLFKTFPLDRISALEIGKKRFDVTDSIDFEKYYQGTFGITNDPNTPVEEVILTFTKFKGSYIKSLPWHPTQKVLQEGDQSLTISLHVKINYELVSEILSHGDELRVDSPKHLGKMVRAKAKNILESKIK
jgi:predicted DNA-binding transcriptional regulator YafY